MQEKCKEYEGKALALLRGIADEDYSEDTNYDSIDRIINGTDAVLGQFPHFASLGYEDDGALTWECGGALISETFVLTAAHCAKRRVPKYARFGVINLGSTKSDTYKIKNIIKHPDYDGGSTYNDIALIELESEVKFTNNIKPACLPTSIDHDFLPRASVYGFGLTNLSDIVQSQVLQYAVVENFSYEECKLKYGSKKRYEHGILEKFQVCYGSHKSNQDSCTGDSGGPLTYLDKILHRIIGVVSFGFGCGRPGTPGIYTRVSSYVPWIQEIVWKTN